MPLTERLADQAAVTLGTVSPTFSLGGGYTQNVATASLYAGYRTAEGPP